MPPHNCTEHERLKRIEEHLGNIDSRLGTGDVSFNTLSLQLDNILEQTKKTNGRVTALEDVNVKEQIEKARNSYGGKQLVRDLVAILASVGVGLTALVSCKETIKKGDTHERYYHMDIGK